MEGEVANRHHQYRWVAIGFDEAQAGFAGRVAKSAGCPNFTGIFAFLNAPVD